jgi:hypothetical protein
MTVSPLPTLSARFGVVSVLPTMVLVGWLAFLLGSGAFVGPPDMNAVFNALAKANIAQVTLFGVAGVALGSVLHPFQFLFVRLLEGYWDDLPVLRRLQYFGIELNRRRMRRLRRTGNTRELHRRYPDAAELLPTKLGNALRAAERSAGRLFGMDAVRMLPRLYPIAAPTISEMFLDLRNQLDVAARYTVTFALITASGLVALITDGWWLALPSVTVLLMWASYRATVRAALSYGQGLHVLFELHHGHLVQALGWEVPKNFDDMRTLAMKLETWLLDNPNANLKPPENYIGPAAAAEKKEATPPTTGPT